MTCIYIFGVKYVMMWILVYCHKLFSYRKITYFNLVLSLFNQQQEFPNRRLNIFAKAHF